MLKLSIFGASLPVWEASDGRLVMSIEDATRKVCGWRSAQCWVATVLSCRRALPDSSVGNLEDSTSQMLHVWIYIYIYIYIYIR